MEDEIDDIYDDDLNNLDDKISPTDFIFKSQIVNYQRNT
jgi:hypothetical protein